MIKHAIVIGASSGGPGVLGDLLEALPANLDAVVVIIQHLPLEFTKRMATRLDSIASMSVTHLETGQHLENGQVYIAPGEHNFFLLSDLTVQMISSRQKALPTPSVDMGFTSVAEKFGPDTIGVVMTGMGRDGVMGCKAIKQLGGTVLVQDEESSAVFGMPKSVQIAGFADEVLNPGQIAVRLIELVGTT